MAESDGMETTTSLEMEGKGEREEESAWTWRRGGRRVNHHLEWRSLLADSHARQNQDARKRLICTCGRRAIFHEIDGHGGRRESENVYSQNMKICA